LDDIAETDTWSEAQRKFVLR